MNDNTTIARDDRNNPIMNFPFDVPVTRMDNTLVQMEAILADFEKEGGGSVTIGYAVEPENTPERKADLIVIYREPTGSQKAYTIPLSVLAGAIIAHHELNKAVPHLRPITEADRELEAAEKDELAPEDQMEREPTADELAAFEAIVPPSVPDQRQVFDSSQIAEASYSTVKQELRVIFKNGGGCYRYDCVPPTVWQDMKEAPSVGSFFARSVNGVFNYEKEA